MARVERATSRGGKPYKTTKTITYDEVAATYVTTDTLEADYIKAGEITFTDISGGTATLGGAANGNGVLDVKDSTGTTKVKINNTGITLADGTSIVGGNGVKACLSSQSVNVRWFVPSISEYTYGQWALGYNTGFISDSTCGNWANFLEINIYIPTNFVTSSAYIVLEHRPIYWDNTSAYWGYCRNIKVYKATGTDYYYTMTYNSSYSDTGNYTLTEIASAFGTNGFTAATPSTPTHPAEIAISANIGTSITQGVNNKIILKTSNAVPTFVGDQQGLPSATDESNCGVATGLASATLYVYGYLK